MLRVTADSNIYISGLTTESRNASAFLELARTGKIRLAVSNAILDEVADVLERKFGWPQEDIAEARYEIEKFTQKVRPTVSFSVVKADPDDDAILECGSTAASGFIVTGDNHLLRLGRYDSMQIVTLEGFLAFVRQRGP